MSESAAVELVIFDIAGMDCADCATSIERVVAKLPVVATSNVSFGTATLTVKPQNPTSSLKELARAVGGAVDRAGYSATMRVDGEMRMGRQVAWWKNRKLIPTAIAIVLWSAACAAAYLVNQPTVSTTLFFLAIVIGGFPIARAAITSLGARRLDMNVLMSISVIGAAAIGEWSEGALVVVLFSIGTTLQAITFDRTRGAIRGLLEGTPEEAVVLRDAVEVTVAAGDLVPGDVVRVRPGVRLAADGEVIEGLSTVQQAAITGEPMPVGKGPGEAVFAGTINGAGTLLVRVTKPASESMLARIVHLVETAQSTKAPSQQLVDRFAAIYTPAVVVSAALVAAGGWILSSNPDTWFYRALVLLVIACPCALVISTPVSIVSAIGSATRMGILVKGGGALEDMARVRTIAFDKTGTLTLGRPSVTAVIPFGDETEASVLSAAASVEQVSEHPLARAIVARALHDNLAVAVATEFQSHPGRGVSANVNSQRISVGGDRLLAELDITAQQSGHVRQLATTYGARGENAIAVLESSHGAVAVLGVIVVADRVRNGAESAIIRLRKSGIRSIAMLSGDRAIVANSVARSIGVDEVRADLLPEQKSSAIASLRARGPVAMIGDGVNDAPALVAADVGIAMGIGGVDLALESADVALMRDDLSSIASLVDLAQRTLTIIRQNVALSMAIKVAALLLATFGFVNLWIAVLADVGTSLIVTLNGLRLARAEQRASIVQSTDEEQASGFDAVHNHDHRQAAD